MTSEQGVQTLRCRIRILSPVHLGCDEAYEPTGFVVDNTKDELVVFDPTAFISGLSDEDKKRLSEICSQGTVGSILAVYKFLQRREAEGKRVNLCNGFLEHYDQVLGLSSNDEFSIKKSLNKFIIERTAFNPYDQRPYIPGSAIKGALRTAYMNFLSFEASHVRTPRGKDGGRELESDLLRMEKSAFQLDPFRLLKVSDFHPVGDTATRIVYAVNKKKKTSKYDARGPYQLLETISPGVCFSGSIRLETPPEKSGIAAPLNLKRLMESLRNFYNREKLNENKTLNGIGVPVIETSSSDARYAIRLGRHSGAECLTIDGRRSIKIMKGRGEKAVYSNAATTVWLASESRKPNTNNGLKPFGWVELDVLSEAEFNALEREEGHYKREKELEILERLDREREENEKRLEELRLKEEERKREELEQRRREEEEAAARAALEAMSPAERDVYALQRQDAPEALPHDIFGRLSEYDDDDRKRVAAALKEYWMSTNNWKVKKTQKKQKAKVDKIKQILGE